MDSIDLDRIKLPANAVGEAKANQKPPRHLGGVKFLRGPIPWPWLERAARLPGKALHVAMIIWHLAGMSDSACVRWQPSVAEKMGLNRWAVRRALAGLERVGLVTVERHRGRCAVITLKGTE